MSHRPPPSWPGLTRPSKHPPFVVGCPAQSPGFNSGSGATIRVTANEVWYYLGKQVHGKDCVRRLSFFHKKFGASVLFVLLGGNVIGATANMSRLDTEMANDLIAFARNLRSRGFVTRPVIHRA